MSKLYDNYATDKSAESTGVWIEDSGAAFKLARMGGANIKFQRALTTAMKPYMREIQLGVIDDAVLEPVMRKVFIDTILLDWRWTDTQEDGTAVVHEHEIPGADDLPVAYNADNAVKLFADLPDLYARLRTEAQSYANYRAATLAVASKN
jgi:hypothetical protein